MENYLDKASGSTIEELKDEPGFQEDLKKFLGGARKGYSEKELASKNVDWMVDEYVEHMRGQDANEVSALKDLFYVRNEENSEEARGAFGRLMQTWDTVEGVGTGVLKGTGDYLEAIVSSPSTLATVFTGGYSKLAALSATKATQFATREAVKKILSKQFAIQAAKGSLKPAIVEGVIAGGLVETKEEIRKETIEDYEPRSVSSKAIEIGTAFGFGGVIGGASKAFSMKQGDKVARLLKIQNYQNSKILQANAKKAVTKLASESNTKAGRKKINDILNRMTDLTSLLVARERKNIEPGRFGASPSKDALDRLKVAEGLDIKKTILTEGANKEITSSLSRHTLQSITAAALEVTDLIQLAPGERISSALARALNNTDPSKGLVLDTKSVTNIIDKYGLTREEFSNVFLSDLSEAGTILGQAGQISRKVAGERAASEIVNITNNIENLAERGVAVFDDKLAQQLSVAMDMPKTKWQSVYEVFKTSDMARIAFMTAQVGTTAANTGFSTLRVGVDIVEESFKEVFRVGHTLAKTGKVPKSNAAGVFSLLKGMTLRKNDQILLKEMYLRDYPEEALKIYKDINRTEVAFDTSSVVGRVSSMMNILNSTVDSHFKQAAFYASMDRQLIKQGSSLNEFLQTGNSLLDPRVRDLRKKAVYDSLDMVFQKSYDPKLGLPQKIAQGTIDLNRKLPYLISGIGGMPFPRYVANHMEFINDYTPLAFATGNIKRFGNKIYSGELKDPTARWARQATGLSLFSGFIMARASQVEFDENGKALRMKTPFMEFEPGEEGDNTNLGRVLGPLNAHALVSDILVRNYYNLPLPKPSKRIKDALEVAGGLGNMGLNKGLINELNLAIDGQKSDYSALVPYLADIVSVFSYPATFARDLEGTIDPDAATADFTKDLLLPHNNIGPYNPNYDLLTKKERESGLVNALTSIFTSSEALNRMVRFLPEYELQYTQTINGKTAPKLYDPIGGGVVRSLHPITKQLLGAETKKPSNTLQKEIANLGLEEYLLYSKNRVKNPVVDLGVRYILSRNLNASFEAFIEKPLAVDNFQTMYKDVSPEQRRFLVKNFIGKQITAAESVVKDHYDSQQGRPRLQTAHARNAFNLNIAGTSKYILDSTIKSLAGKNMSMADYINQATSVTDELYRKRQIMRLNNLQEKQQEK